VHLRDAHGQGERMPASAVLDASGTWYQPGWAGGDGLPAIGEATAQELISYRIPDDVSAYAGRRVFVVGAGHSATHAVLRLADLARGEPGTTITWALRRGSASNVVDSEGDELPERAALGARAKEFIDSGLVTLVTGFRVA